MEPIFSIEYSEYCVAEELSKILYIPKLLNVSVFVPASRHEKGIDLILYRHEESSGRNFTTTVQVKSSRVYHIKESDRVKNNDCRFALWFPRFKPSPRADFFVLTAQYPQFPKTTYLTQGRRGNSSASVCWNNLFLLFSHDEMVQFLNRVKNKSGRPDQYFGLVFNTPSAIYTQRGFYDCTTCNPIFEDISRYSLTVKNKKAIQKLQNALMPPEDPIIGEEFTNN